jgi:hypothetical protein
MSENPKECVLKETGTCVGWVCMSCSTLHTTAIYLCPPPEAAANARAAAERCCTPQHCACGAEVRRYSKQCDSCWRAEQEAKDEARWQAAPKQTIAEYLKKEPDGWVCDDDQFWSVDSYIDDEVYLRHPRVWFCEASRGISLDAADITESWADDRHEDAQDDLDLTGLQALLDDWCAKQQTVSWCATGTALDPAEVERLCRERAAEEPS